MKFALPESQCHNMANTVLSFLIMKKSTLVTVLLLILVVGFLAYLFFSPKNINDLIGEKVQVVVFTQDNNLTGKAMLVVPFLRGSSERLYINAVADLNRDGHFAPFELNGAMQSEWIAKNMLARSARDWNNNFYFALLPGLDFTSDKTVRLVLSGQPVSNDSWSGEVPVRGLSVEKKIVFTRTPLPELVNLSTVTKPEESMKGAQLAFAQAETEGVPDTFRSDVPDIAQRPDECAPTSAANSLIRLAGDHEKIDAIPRDPYELVDQLKKEMKWTSANGVLVDDFVAGKDAVAAQLGLKIRTTKVGQPGGGSTINDIDQALQRGGAAEMRLRFTNPAGANAGGHLVTVTGVYSEGRRDFVNIHDPLSGSGTDTYEVLPDGSLKDYPYNTGGAFVSFGYVQIWDESMTLTPPAAAPVEPAVKKKTVKVIVVNGHKIPIDQVHIGEGPECDNPRKTYPHYHANKDKVPRDLNKVEVPDPNPAGCGYGKVKDVPVEDADIP